MQLNITRKTKPRKTSDRKRVNKAFIKKMAAFRGYTTGNEKTSLTTLDVKNALQRINNRSMSDDVNDNFNGTQNEVLQKLMREFVKNVDAVINSK